MGAMQGSPRPSPSPDDHVRYLSQGALLAVFDDMVRHLLDLRPVAALIPATLAQFLRARMRQEPRVESAATLEALIPPADRMEADTAQDEDAVDLETLLLPDGRLPMDVLNFSLHVCHAALNGWVKQTSPACAAASTAGAWNTVLGLRRDAEEAHNQDSVMDVLRDILKGKVDEARARLERLWLQQSPASPLDEAVREELAKAGLTLGGESKTVKGATKRQVWAAVQAVCMETAASPTPAGDDTEFRRPGGCFAALRVSWAAEKLEPSSPMQSAPATTISASKRRPKSAAGEEVEEEAEEEDEGPTDATGGGDPGPQAARKEVLEYFHFVAGMDKLTRPKPTTAIFGNWGILQAMKRLSDAHPSAHVSVRLFMGRKAVGSIPEIPIAAKDTAADAAVQWERLCREFRRPATALIFHLTNHYALIFALREWVTPAGEEVRQVLTTRRGQRPTVWLDWAECRQIMLRSLGYKVMSVHRAD
eukprot:GGOE01019696.1.p1 GENE.GGOE01019696.1~~GGOE01019696.1.p1  ORF type:complete len:478 (-),score=160.34 GGOE01019696.1:371-1804(-)